MKKMYAEFWHTPCQNRDEELIAENLRINLPENSIAEPVCFAGISNGKRNTEKQASLYDCMMAEIMAEKTNRERKFMRTHRADNSKKDETKADRKLNKQNRMRKMYGLDAFEDTKHGKTVFCWATKGGQKKFPEYEAEIFRNLKVRTAEKIARADWEIECAEIELNAEFEYWERMEKFQEWLKWA